MQTKPKVRLPSNTVRSMNHAFILGGDKVNVMTFIFIQHSADREGHGERLAKKQGVHST